LLVGQRPLRVFSLLASRTRSKSAQRCYTSHGLDALAQMGETLLFIDWLRL
jgi:hypothetical protein